MFESRLVIEGFSREEVVSALENSCTCYGFENVITMFNVCV